MRQIVIAGAMIAATTCGALAQNAGWVGTKSCSVTSPTAAAPFIRLNLSDTGKADGPRRSLVFTIVTPEGPATAAAGFAKARIDVGALTLGDLRFSGTPEKEGYRLSASIRDKQDDFLKALAAGAEVKVTVPAAGGDKTYTAALAGSGAAVGSLLKCFGG